VNRKKDRGREKVRVKDKVNLVKVREKVRVKDKAKVRVREKDRAKVNMEREKVNKTRGINRVRTTQTDYHLWGKESGCPTAEKLS
jgi:hypothetical protein